MSADNPALEAIWHVVCAIPPGRIAAYGTVARAAGYPGRARQAGYALKVVPEEMNVPWYRVTGAGGRIAFPAQSTQHRLQCRLLRAEGITVRNGRADPGALLDAGEL